MALFGVVWVTAGATTLGGVTETALLGVSWIFAAVICISSISLKRRAVIRLYHDDSPEARLHRKASSRRFNLVFTVQGVAILLAVVLLGRFGFGALIPPAISFVVGAHFFPLAKLYGVEKYYVTGAFLCSLALIVVLIAPQQYWLTLVGLGSGWGLFTTAVYALFRGVNQLRSGVRA